MTDSRDVVGDDLPMLWRANSGLGPPPGAVGDPLNTAANQRRSAWGLYSISADTNVSPGHRHSRGRGSHATV